MADGGHSFDVVVIGSGPAGHKAAIQAAKAGRRVLVVDRERRVGGACVQSGTIPSKTLRETAVYLSGLRSRCPSVFPGEIPEDLRLASLMSRMNAVVAAHHDLMAEQLERNGIEFWHGRARLRGAHEVEVEDVRWGVRRVEADRLVIATGSRPRVPPGVPVDHEHVLDSDSVLSMTYVPRTLTVLGGGVIAAEYASIFAALGVEVTMVDRHPRPIAFVDAELTDRFVEHFESLRGCRFLGGRSLHGVAFDGIAHVETRLEDGEVVRSEKVLCALGRVANLEHLDLAAAGLEPTERGLIRVDEHCRTAVPWIYAVGDVIGPPALAASAMEQGRRAACHALGLPVPGTVETIPMGIYTVPEMSSVGLSEAEARERHGACTVGRARFEELARGQIAGNTAGLLKLVADGAGRELLGAQIVGEGATELIHVAQMALTLGGTVEGFVDNIFNFPTLAEGYRVAALDLLKGRRPLARAGGAASLP